MLTKTTKEIKAEQPEGYPYVFVPPRRYEHLQSVRKGAKLPIRQANCPVGNFRRQFQIILGRAVIRAGQFHDLRRTCITNWFANGLTEFEVMILAGHASFDTTRKFYMAVRNDLIDKARVTSQAALREIAIAKPLQVPSGAENEKGSQL